MLRRFVYLSTGADLMGDRDLLELLRRASENNKRYQLTGLLLYMGGNFIQLLEGAPDPVGSLFAKIEKDPRHHSCITMLDCDAAQRLFPDWSMAFRPSADLSVEERKEIGDFLAAMPKIPSSGDGKRALRLMETFAQLM